MPPNIHVEVNGISITAIGQNPKFYPPLNGLVPDVLPNARPMSRFNHTFINGNILFGLIQTKAPGFEIADERIYFPQLIPGVFCIWVYNMQKGHEDTKPIP